MSFTYNHSTKTVTEVATTKKPICILGIYPCTVAGNKRCECEEYNNYIASLRTYPAIGFSQEDEGEVSEKDFRLQHQQSFGDDWVNCDEIVYKKRIDRFRRIVAIPLPVKEEQSQIPDCSQHPKDLFGHSDMKEVGEAIANMHYESLPQLLYHFSKKIELDGKKDYSDGKEKTAAALQYLGFGLFEAALRAEKLWKVVKPFMTNETK